ncbi:MAG: aspartate kinase [Clostridiales bacterium]|nr:aspartate kinase [Clostridiales bacterium]
MLIVQKFGGSSVADALRVGNVARRIGAAHEKGNKIVVVLSAQGDTTDDLLHKARELNSRASSRELDMLLSTGEQQSIALMAIALHGLGYPAVSLTGPQAGIHSSSSHGNARIKSIDTERITSELERNNIVIVAGFQGINRYGDVTTLGRGGSDTSAVALAAALHADLCEIYTDVEGVYTADPRIVPSAKKLDEISYDEMLELASLGAKVLATRSVEMAKKYQVNLIVRSSMSIAEGTLVKEEVNVENTYISGLAMDKNVASISVIGVMNKPGTAFKLFQTLSKEKISVDIILQSIGRDKTKDISFTVTKQDLPNAVRVLMANKTALGFDSLSFDDKIVKLSVVGAGMATNPGVASMLFEALYNGGINIMMISTSEIKISVLIDERDADNAANCVHTRFFSSAAAFSVAQQ